MPKFCPECGAEIKYGAAKFCPECGFKLKVEEKVEEKYPVERAKLERPRRKQVKRSNEWAMMSVVSATLGIISLYFWNFFKGLWRIRPLAPVMFYFGIFLFITAIISGAFSLHLRRRGPTRQRKRKKRGKLLGGKKLKIALLTIVVVTAVVLFLVIDWDRDGLATVTEFRHGTSAFNPDTDGDGLKDGLEVNTYGTNPFKPNPAVKYGIDKGLGLDMLKKLQVFDQDEMMDEDERKQIEFLSDLDETTLQQAVKENLICNFDWDNDQYTNWFEMNISKTNFSSPNKRYLILCYVISTPLEITNDLAKYMNESITIAMYEENATFNNFVSAIDEVKSSSDADDTVVIILDGHGSRLGFSFWDGLIPYDSINEQLNKLSSKIILLNDSCYSGASLQYLSSTSRVIMSQVNENQIGTKQIVISKEVVFEWLHPLFFEALNGKFADNDKNGYVSCLEAFLWAKERLGPFYIDNTTYERSPQISGTELAENLYLIEKYP